MKTFLGSLILLLVPLSFLKGQDLELPVFITDSLDTYIERSIRAWNIPGVAVAIIKDGKPVVIKGYGEKETGKRSKVNENTLFMVASNTKAFTGTAMTLLENDGLCSLDDRVTQWLPDFRLHDPATTSLATLEDLLVHRMGYATFQGDFMYFYSDLKPEDVYRTYSKLEPFYPFRTTYGYSNIGYFYAGECIEKISGMPWNDYLRTKILDPLKMDRTTLLSSELAEASNKASGHTLETGELKMFPYPDTDLLGPAAGMASSASDLSHWLAAQLEDGEYEGNTVIPESVLQKTRRPKIFTGKGYSPYNHSNFELYGLGWSMKDYEGVEIVSHTGGVWGFVSEVSFIPDLRLGVAVLTNSDENWFYEALTQEIHDAFLHLPYRDYSGLYLSWYKRRAAKQQDEIEALKKRISQDYPLGLPLDSFVGIWTNPVYGEIRITAGNPGLLVAFQHHPDLVARLEPLADSTFLCTYTPSRFGTHKLKVEADGPGKLVIHLKVADRLERTGYEFRKGQSIQ